MTNVDTPATRYDPMTGKPIVPTPAPHDAAAPAARAVRKPPHVKEPTKEQRVDSLIAGYAFGLEHNTPRTPAELAELRWALGKELKPTPLTADERKAMATATVTKVAKDAFLQEKGDPVPVNVALTPVPAAVVTAHPDLAGCSYCLVDDKIMIVDIDRKVVAVV